MAGTKQNNSSNAEGTKDSGFKFPCCNFENMSEMMRKFCGGEDGTFDCEAMMKKMCCMAPKESKEG